MYLIISGKVEVQKHADDGCDVDLAEMGDGEYFGEMALFDNEKRSATVQAQEETQVLVLHKQEFSEAVREYPQLALQMCKELSRRLRELHQKIQTLPVCF
jgi:CRP-like cAMP-binding protein